MTHTACARCKLRASLGATALAVALALGGIAAAGEALAQQAPAAYAPAPENLAARAWFQDAKFGIFIHWGLYSEVAGIGNQKGLSEWVMNEAKVPAKDYERLALFFNPQRFDAGQWVKTFKDAGAKYIVITSKHHDGFAMYHSKVSPYNIVDATPFGRDPLKELAEACRAQGIKLFFYYSQIDWHHPDYFPRGTTGHFTGRPEKGDWERYLQYQDAQLRELLTDYGAIGGIWLDGYWDLLASDRLASWRIDRTYQLIHELQPAAMILNNHHQLPLPGEDYQGFERDLPGDNTRGYNVGGIGALPLEMAETMNGTWGYSAVDHDYKSPEKLVRTLVAAAGRNANLLLNTGPMPNGMIQPENVETFQQIGQWLRTHGASIYGTRGGPLAPRPWGVTTQNRSSVFVHILDWKDEVLVLPLKEAVATARVLGTNTPVRFTQAGGELTLHGAARPAGEWVHTIELTFK